MISPRFPRRFWERRRKSVLSSDAAGDLLTRVARADNAVEHGALAPDRARAVFEAALAEAMLINAAEAAAQSGKRDRWLSGRRITALGLAASVAGAAVFVATRNPAADEAVSVARTPSIGDAATMGRAFPGSLSTLGSGLTTARFNAQPSPFTPTREPITGRRRAGDRTAPLVTLSPRSPGWAAVSARRIRKPLRPSGASALFATPHPAATTPRYASVVRASDTAGFDDALTSGPADDGDDGSNVTYCGVELPATYSVVADADTVESRDENAVDESANGKEVTAFSATDSPVSDVLLSQNSAVESDAVENSNTASLIENEEPRLAISVSRPDAVSDTTDASHSALASWGGVVTARRIPSGDREAAGRGYAEASRVYEEDSVANRNPVATTLAPVGGASPAFANATWMRCVVRGTDIPRVLVARLPVNPDRSLAVSTSGPADAR